MEYLLEELSLYFCDSPLYLALTGSGGKSTTMVKLAKEYAQLGRRVLLSTTTKLLLPRDYAYGCDTYFLDDRALFYTPSKGERVFYAHLAHKAVAPPIENLERLLDRYDTILLEADGSANLGLKLHQERDPRVPSFVNATLALLSMYPLGKPFLENCFGAKAYSKEFPEQTVSLATYKKLLEHEQGVLKRVQGKTLVLCTRSTEEDKELYTSLLSSLTLPYPLWFGDSITNQLIYRSPV